MTVISAAVAAAAPSPLPGAVVDSPLVNFAAMFDVEMAVSSPAIPMMIKDAGAGGEQVAPPIAATTTSGANLVEDSGGAAVPDLPIVTDLVAGEGHSAVMQSPDLVLGQLVAMPPLAIQLATERAVATGDPSEDGGFPSQPGVERRALLQTTRSMPGVAKTRKPEQFAEPMTMVRLSKAEVAAEMPLIALAQQTAPLLDYLVPAIEGGRTAPIISPSHNTPVERLLAALSHDSPAERQWLDTVIRDVASIAVKSGGVRFRVEPEGYGRMTIERTADRLEISVADPRAMVVAEAARTQVVAGAATLGVPVAGATVVLDQSGQRGPDEARQRQQIEHRDADEAGDDRSADIGRYA